MLSRFPIEFANPKIQKKQKEHFNYMTDQFLIKSTLLNVVIKELL